MKNNKLYSIYDYKDINTETIVSAVFNTYQKIVNGCNFDELLEEDIQIIKNFYYYLTIESAKDMLSERHKIVALEEMKSYVGDYLYPLEMKKVFLNKYLELLEYNKQCNLLQEDSLRLA